MVWLAAALASPLVLPDNTPYQLVDADGDGHVDLVFGGGEAAFFGDGTGHLGSLVPLTAGTEADDVAYADLDGDGLPEACRAWWDHVDCHQCIGRGIGPVQGQLGEAGGLMTAVDWGMDRSKELVATSSVSVGTFDAAFAFTAISPHDPTVDLVPADLDNDGDIDLVSVQDGGMWALWNRSIGDGLPPPQGTVDDTGTVTDTGTPTVDSGTGGHDPDDGRHHRRHRRGARHRRGRAEGRRGIGLRLPRRGGPLPVGLGPAPLTTRRGGRAGRSGSRSTPAASRRRPRRRRR
jgi:hypothetical protein